MNRDDVGRVIVERGEPFLFLPRRPVLFDRCDVIVRLGRFRLKRPGRVHRGKAGRAQILRRFFDSGPDLGRDRDNPAVNDKPADRLQILLRVRNQTLLARMVLLYFLENFDGLPARVDFFCRVHEDLLFAPQFAHPDFQNFFRRKFNEFTVAQHLLKLLTTEGITGVCFRQLLALQPRHVAAQFADGPLVDRLEFCQ